MSLRVLRCLALLVPGAVLVTLLPGASARPEAATDKWVYASVVDEAGKPVKDLTREDFALREDGEDRVITDVKLATDPLYIQLLADTSTTAAEFTQDIRATMSAFVKEVLTNSPGSQISLMEFGQAAVTMIPYSSSEEALAKGINRLIGKPNSGSVLSEALIEANKQLAKTPSLRRAIVSLNMEPSTEGSREEPKVVNDSFRKSTAQLWALSLQKGSAKNAERDVLLNNLAKYSGGQREIVVGQSSMVGWFKQFADNLTSQYQITYNRPGKAAQVVQVGCTRTGARLHASAYAPQ
jgi:VWFA-related protein